jgi:23S rRNA (adenine-N6)-dimethyltransferase
MSSLSRSPRQTALSYHRLATPGIARRIVASTGLAPPGHVVEFGAGDGQLTAALLRRGLTVTAAEADPALVCSLRERFAGATNLTIRAGDFFRLPPSAEPYHVVANPPFSRTSDLLRHLLTIQHPPRSAWLVLQREAAERWAGLAGETAVSVLAKVRCRFDVRLAVRRRDFRPFPSVDCVVLGMTFVARRALAAREEAEFTSFVRLGFGRGYGLARKNLAPVVPYGRFRTVSREHGFTLEALPSELCFEQWLALFDARER